MDEHKTVSISKDELRRIMSLPKVRLKIGGETKAGYLDEEAEGMRAFYPIDEDGALTGKVAKIPPSVYQSGPEHEAPGHQPQDSGEPQDNELPDPEGPKKGKGLIGNAPVKLFGREVPKRTIIIAVAAILVGCITLALVLPSLFFGRGPDDDTSPDASPIVSAVVREDVVQVIQVRRTLIPGQVLAPEDMEEVSISQDLYDSARNSGRDLYTWDAASLLEGHYANDYITAGSYLEFDDIDAVSPFPLLPWSEIPDDEQLIPIEVDESMRADPDLIFGEYITIKIEKTYTVRDVDSDPTASPIPDVQVPEPDPPVDDPIDAPGDPQDDPVDPADTQDPEPAAQEPGPAMAPATDIELTTVTTENKRIEEYTIKNMVICDILNADGQSIYPFYCAYIGIPIADRPTYLSNALREDETLELRLTPAYIMVAFTNDQAKEIGDLDAWNVSVSFIPQGSVKANTNDRYRFALESAEIKRVLNAAMVENAGRVQAEGGAG